MQNVNRVILVGRLGLNPVVRSTKSGAPVCQLRIATHRRAKKPNGETGYQLETQWHTVVVWGKVAETCGSYLTQGSQVYVEGRIKTQMFTDRSGVQRMSVEIESDRIQFLEVKEARTKEPLESEVDSNDLESTSSPENSEMEFETESEELVVN